MPVSVKDIAKKAEFSHMLGINAHRIAYPVYSAVRGGLENATHSLIIGNSLFASAHLNAWGIHAPTIIHHRTAETLLLLVSYDHENARSLKTTFN